MWSESTQVDIKYQVFNSLPLSNCFAVMFLGGGGGERLEALSQKKKITGYINCKIILQKYFSICNFAIFNA